MAQERLPMRKIREVLRLRYELGRGCREIARACGVSHSTALDYLRRAQAAGLAWPQAGELTGGNGGGTVSYFDFLTCWDGDGIRDFGNKLKSGTSVKKEAKDHFRIWQDRWGHYRTIHHNATQVQANLRLVLHGNAPRQLAGAKSAPLQLPMLDNSHSPKKYLMNGDQNALRSAGQSAWLNS